MSQKRRTCIFCGSDGKMSGEHVIPDWVSRLYPSKSASPTRYTRLTQWVTGNGAEPAPSAPYVDKLQHGRLAQVQVNRVCRACNNTWMSRIEEACKPLLAPMILDGGIHLDEPAQKQIAIWAVMKSMVYDSFTPLLSTTTFHARQAFRADPARVAHGWRVYIGRNGSQAWREHMRSEALRLNPATRQVIMVPSVTPEMLSLARSPRLLEALSDIKLGDQVGKEGVHRDTLIFTLGVGSFLLHVFHSLVVMHPEDDGNRAEIEKHLGYRRVWPPVRRTLQWSALPAMTDEQCGDMHFGLTKWFLQQVHGAVPSL